MIVFVGEMYRSGSTVAIKRATEMLYAGDVDGYAVWKRILNAVKELLTDEPPDDSIIH